MAVQHHDDIEVVQGDDWVIPFSVGIDLTGQTLEWTLVDPNGNLVPNLTPTVTVTAPTNLGNGTITLPNSQTVLGAGRYQDTLRTVGGGVIETEWIGFIDVDASDFEDGDI